VALAFYGRYVPPFDIGKSFVEMLKQFRKQKPKPAARTAKAR
jgi:hypothetical protein